MENVPYPIFTYNHYTVWFAQMESAFLANGVDEEIDKFRYAVAHIPAASLSVAEDLVLNPPVIDPYKSFKYEFIKRLTISYMNNASLRDDKPSEFLKKLQRLGAQRVPEEIVINTWRNKLPEHVRQVLSLDNTRDINQQSELADTVMSMTRKLVPAPRPEETWEAKLAKCRLVERLAFLESRMDTISRALGYGPVVGVQPAQNRNPAVPVVGGQPAQNGNPAVPVVGGPSAQNGNPGLPVLGGPSAQNWNPAVPVVGGPPTQNWNPAVPVVGGPPAQHWNPAVPVVGRPPAQHWNPAEPAPER